MALRFRAEVLAGQGEWKGIPLFTDALRIPLWGKDLKGVWKIRPLTRRIGVTLRHKELILVWETRLILFCEGRDDYFTLLCDHRWESRAVPERLGLEPASLQEGDNLEGTLGPVRWETGVSGDVILLRLWGDIRVSAFRQEVVSLERQEEKAESKENGEELLHRLVRWTEEQQRQSRAFYRKLQQRYARLGHAMQVLEGGRTVGGELERMRETLAQLEERLNIVEGSRKAAGAGVEAHRFRVLRPPADFS